MANKRDKGRNAVESPWVSPFGTPLAKLPTCATRSKIPAVPTFINDALNFLEDNGNLYKSISN